MLKYIYELYEYFKDNNIQGIDNYYQDNCFHILYFDEGNNSDLQKTFYGMYNNIRNKLNEMYPNLDQYILDLMFSNYYS